MIIKMFNSNSIKHYNFIYTLFRIKTNRIATELGAAGPPSGRLVNYSVIVNICGGSSSGDRCANNDVLSSATWSVFILNRV